MLTATNLEQVIELENNLKSQYQAELDVQTEKIDGLIKEKEAQQAVIATQLQQITALSTEATENKRVQQLNRELNNRTEKLLEETTELKKRVKALQKDLAKEREELKALKQFDPAKMKKNLDAGKKKLAEKQAANDLMQKSLSKGKTEKAELQQQIKTLEAKLEELENTEEEKEAVAA